MPQPPTRPAPQSTTPPAPLAQITLRDEDLKDPSLGLLNNVLANLQQSINYLLGHSGTPTIKSGLDLSGQRIVNVGTPQHPDDAVSHAFAQSRYGPEALRPHFEQLGKAVFQSYRRLSDSQQRERYSSFLNSVLTVAPTTNTSKVTFGSPSGGFVSVNISSGLHQLVDGTELSYSAFNDSLALPSSFAISGGGLTRTGGIVTGATAAPHTLVAGETIAIGGQSNTTFNGQFVLATAVSPNFSYNQIAPDATSTGGAISLNGVYYYSRRNGQNTLFRTGPFAEDSWSNRRSASLDGSTLIAVAVVTGTGGDNTNSAAGGTSPAVNNGAGIRIFGRL